MGMENVSPVVRKTMQAVRRKDTRPEMVVRRLLHRLGYRYRLHEGKLPGCPDIVFGGRKKAIFVHGCFWHGHDCRRSLRPKSRTDYWESKVFRNRARDLQNESQLTREGWEVLTVWECTTTAAGLSCLETTLKSFLGARNSSGRSTPRRGERSA